ncbi:hypothetical protein HYALB_00012332 [Hymenoscyphus albidus]|uniref:Fatty acid desaturase domain-containing protein n=1 Tax=Hymenoscyphus albidus TaxID=595503 RepID=A0A9N9Q510_9HELO|nr:hypothetical protein HYALB_00012332 [Hymenoscyphus albidus]
MSTTTVVELENLQSKSRYRAAQFSATSTKSQSSSTTALQTSQPKNTAPSSTYTEMSSHPQPTQSSKSTTLSQRNVSNAASTKAPTTFSRTSPNWLSSFTFTNKYLTPENVPSYALRVALWGFYTVVQGILGSGLWVLGHECGHQTFSKYKVLNDSVGWVLHSILLVPYFSWKITHRNHHKGIANMRTDTSWVPFTRLAYTKYFGTTLENVIEYAEDTPIYTLFYLIAHQLITWPVYMTLMAGVGDAWFEKQEKMKGNPNPPRNEDGTIVQNYEFRGSHTNPYSPHFTPRDAKFIFITDIGLAITWAFLLYVGYNYGWANIAVWYGIPYLWVDHWLISLTYLHHVDGTLPPYNPSQWTFVRGAAATIDRDFGFVDRWFFHNIIGTHVLHHHVSIISHYHAARASEAIKPVMGIHYREDQTGKGMWNFLRNFWRNSKACSWVEPSEGARGGGKDILFYSNRIGVGVKPVEMKLE